MPSPRLPLVVVLAVLPGAALTAGLRGDVGQNGDPPSWSRDVRPLLAERCFLCHGPDPSSREADLRLDLPEGYGADLGGYRAVVPGNPDDSELLWRVAEAEGEDAMPPDGHGERLSADEVSLLRRWIAAGAEWETHWAYAPFHEVVPPGQWSTGIGLAYADWPRNPVDHFALASMAKAGVAPAPEADRRTLIRRLSLDLRGLQPSVAEVEAFLADDADGAYERVVDRFLADPAFAERWARHWLDLGRYADSHGFTVDGPRTMWPWRDWVVDAIDRDLAFDRFTVEQLAGDLLPDATRATRIATGFHRNTQVNQEGGAKDEENRINAVIDRVNTTASVWLGSTAGCAQCHDHKFDPLTQREYFQLYAFFDGTADGGVSAEPALLVPPPGREAEIEAWELREVELRSAVRAQRAKVETDWILWQPTRVSGSNGPEFRLQADGSWRVLGQNPEYSTYFLEGAPVRRALRRVRIEALPDTGLPGGGPGRAGNGNFVLQQVRLMARPIGGAWHEIELAEPRAEFEQDTSADGGSAYPAGSVLDDGGSGWAVKPAFGTPHALELSIAGLLPTELEALRIELVQEHGGLHTLGRFRVMFSGSPAGDGPLIPDARRAAWDAYAMHLRARPKVPRTLVMETADVPRTTRLFRRGSFLDPGEVVRADFPEAWNHFAAGPAADAAALDRLDLARWLTDPRNALVWRVTVNRWWQQMFGTGLVPTQDDFGFRGAEPSDPELLEWLAQELVRNGFSRKQLLRTIVTSAVYRQDSRPRPELAAMPGSDALFARQRRLRLDGEVLRDAALTASGLLDRTRGGPPVQPPQPDGVFAFTQSQRQWHASEGPARFRRSLYTRLWRSAPYPFFATFGLPEATTTCTRRARANTPLQALAMANDPMLLEIARGFAEDLLRDDEDDAARLTSAYLRVLARPPSAAERQIMLDHLAGVRELGDEVHAWTAICRLLFNLDEFLTRP